MLKITLLALGSKMPNWVTMASEDYALRLAEWSQLKIIEHPLIRRGKSSDLQRIMEKEAEGLKQAFPQGARKIALDKTGETFDSEGLATKIQQLQQTVSHLCLVIGGPEGFLPSTLASCDERWSLSKLTLPHTLVRIVLLETLYRALAIIHHHPYHK